VHQTDEVNKNEDNASRIAYLFGLENREPASENRSDVGLGDDELIDEEFAENQLLAVSKNFYNPRDAETRSIHPTMLRDIDNNAIIAPGMLYWIYGEPGTKKTWLALKLLSEVPTIYIDLESEAWQMGSRLQNMQVEREQSKYFLNPQSSHELLRWVQDIVSLPIDAVVIDAASGLFRLFGLDPNNDQDVAQLFGDILKPIRASGKAVIVIDHIAKNAGNKDFPFGSQNKKAQSDVCLYLKLEDHSNDSVVVVTKDRHFSLGHLVKNVPGDLGVMKLEGDPIRVNIYPIGSYELEVVVLKNKEQEAQDIVLEYIRKNPGMLFGAMDRIKGVSGTRKAPARDRLIELGLVEVRQAPRKNSAVNNKCLYAVDKEDIVNE
jgi:hypothetical protein